MNTVLTMKRLVTSIALLAGLLCVVVGKAGEIHFTGPGSHPEDTVSHTHAITSSAHHSHTHRVYAATDHTHKTPNPPASNCSYKHRLTSVPAMTGGGYTSQILISSEELNATATIRVFQSSNGNQIDVLDSTNNAISGSVSLAPANSSKRFKLEGVQGWHTVIVEHPSERAMRRATVVMRLREPGGGVSIVPMEGVSDCETTGTNTE